MRRAARGALALFVLAAAPPAWAHGDSARLGSFTRAAEELNVTQAAVSQQVKLLEQHLGNTLFIREAKGLRLLLNIEQGVRLPVRGDPVRLRQVDRKSVV